MSDDLAARSSGTELRPGVWQHAFEDAGAFLQALHPLSGYWQPDEKWIFRGHADADWPLLPSAHRLAPWKSLASVEISDFNPTRTNEPERVRRELRVVREFFEAADEAGLTLPDYARLKAILESRRRARGRPGAREWPDDELVPLLALAQHYGLPTRLLDWSRVGRNAAYFAARDPEHGPSHLAVWALNSSASPEVRSSMRGKWHFGSAPRSSNQNLHAQAGLFTYCHWDVDELQPLDELMSSNLVNFMSATRRAGPAPCLMKKIVLPRAAAKDLMRLLHLDGVSALTMFPGFAGAAKHVQERLWCGLVQPPLLAH